MAPAWRKFTRQPYKVDGTCTRGLHSFHAIYASIFARSVADGTSQIKALPSQPLGPQRIRRILQA